MEDIPGIDPGLSAARRLLSRLRDVMAGAGDPQAKLDKIVALIAAELAADVCSCYVMRPGEVLELFSTVGLKPEAVHRTRLRAGEGLVGLIAQAARPMASADARQHPSFAYRPETGEEVYAALMGVPIMRGGRVRGVLVIQSRASRDYAEEEVEILQTVAMVTAELIVGADMAGRDRASGTAGAGLMPSRIQGETINAGLAEGLAVLHRPQLTMRQMVADDPERERQRLATALTTMHRSLEALSKRTADSGQAEPQEILEAYRTFAHDPGWLSRIDEAIRSGLTAEAAVQRVHEAMAARMSRITDPFWRERLLDLEDLATRLLHHLQGRRSVAEAGTLPDNTVVVARTMGPAELLDYDHDKLCALILAEGSATSHVATVARALDIPVVGRCPTAMALIEPFDQVIVDGDNAQVFIRPGDDVQAAFQQNVELRARRRREYAEVVGLPATTRDGVTVSLNINAGLLIDLAHIDDTGADGVGLFRTEIPFMVRPSFPDVDAQTELYAKILDRVHGKPVTFRTLDIGGDKRLPYFDTEEQENPSLGWRALRIGLDRPALLRQQLRALLQAADGRPLSLMFPMVADLTELTAARRLLDAEMERADAKRRTLPASVAVGAMIEVPSVLWQLPAILGKLDFVAVGSNDLVQYLFAADRNNPKTAARYDALSPPFLNAMAHLLAAAAKTGVPVTLCGEMAGRPLDAMALVGLGFRRLSMAPAEIGPVKKMLRSLTLAPVAEFVDELRALPDRSVRDRLRAFALDHGINT